MTKGVKHGIAILALAAMAILGGCATARRSEETVVYPPFPEEPRVAYVQSVQGGSDFYKRGFLDVIFGVPSGADFRQPYGVSASGDKIYIADSFAGVVFVIDTKQEKIDTLGASSGGGAVKPIEVAATSDGTAYVTDLQQKKVFVYGPTGDFKFAIGRSQDFKTISGIAVNEALGRVYVLDTRGRSVRVYGLTGEPLFQFGKAGNGDGEFESPTNIAFDRKTGNLYIVDAFNFRVQVFDKDGKFIRKFGQLGDQPGTFSRPKGIGIDSDGHIYVVDAAFNNFQIFDQEGRLLMDVGNGGVAVGQFRLPAGLYVDEKDRIYVVDSLNKRVQVFQYLSENWKKDHPEEYQKYLQLDLRSTWKKEHPEEYKNLFPGGEGATTNPNDAGTEGKK